MAASGSFASTFFVVVGVVVSLMVLCPAWTESKPVDALSPSKNVTDRAHLSTTPIVDLSFGNLQVCLFDWQCRRRDNNSNCYRGVDGTQLKCCRCKQYYSYVNGSCQQTMSFGLLPTEYRNAVIWALIALVIVVGAIILTFCRSKSKSLARKAKLEWVRTQIGVLPT